MKNGRVWSLGLLSLAAMWVAGGCSTLSRTSTSTPISPPKTPSDSTSRSRGGPPADYTSKQTTPSSLPPCPTGNCDPIGNGEGLYFAKDTHANYCLVKGKAHFFPEAFVNAAGGVVIVGRSHAPGGAKVDWKNAPGAVTRKVFVSVGGGEPVRMASMTSDAGELAITYGTGAGARTVRGKELESLVISIPDGDSGRTSTNLRVALVDGSKQYTVKYGSSADHLNQDLCAGERVSFLPGKRIEAGTGKVTLTSGTTTLSCESGAIAKCMTLGYTSWDAKQHTGVTPDDVNRLFASCLQGIRATYLAGQGDFTSFTRDGTLILVSDPYIMVGEMKRIEALWSPQGPDCINTENLRLPVPRDVVEKLEKLTRCSSGLQGAPPAKLATGPADQLPQSAPVALGSP